MIMTRGRKMLEDTTPGKVLALGALANVPIFVAFVLALLLTSGDVAAARRFVPAVVWVTPIFALLSLGVFLRAPPERKEHRASRMGAVLAMVALLLWALVIVSLLRAPA